MQPNSIKDQVLVFVERKNQAIDGSSLSLMTKARDLATKMSRQLIAVMIGQPGEDVGLPTLREKGIDEALFIAHPELGQYNPELFPKVLADLVRGNLPSLFLMPHTVTGVEVASGVAGRIGVPPVTNCVDIEPAEGLMRVTRPMFGATRQATLLMANGTPIVGSLQSRTWPPGSPGPNEPKITQYDPSTVGDLISRIKVLATVEPAKGEVDVTASDIVVSVGRGIGAKSNIPLYRELAEALGGVLACSRPLTDLEWMPTEHLVGISGSTVKPKVYLACGISGAYQHLAGMQEAQTIIAINSDPTAPIFEVAQYGVVMDLNQVIPSLLEQAKASRFLA